MKGKVTRRAAGRNRPRGRRRGHQRPVRGALLQEGKPDARILILDNHDDHAKRNEFTIGGQNRIGYGGTESIDTPSGYTGVSRMPRASRCQPACVPEIRRQGCFQGVRGAVLQRPGPSPYPPANLLQSDSYGRDISN
jgi:hypothetical protein